MLNICMELDKKLLQWSKYLPYKNQEFNRLTQSEPIVNKEIDLTYKFNSNGFRTHEFNINNTEDCCLSLGSSYTFGTGMPIEQTWPSLLEEKIGMKVYNLGLGASSGDTCVRLALGWIDVLKPKKIFVLWGGTNRFELFTNKTEKRIKDIRQSSAEEFNPDYTNTDPFLINYFKNPINGKLNAFKNKIIMKNICKENNIDLYDFTYIGQHKLREKSVTFARDGRHKGIDFQKSASNLFEKMLLD